VPCTRWRSRVALAIVVVPATSSVVRWSPKNLALAGPERAALVFGAPMIVVVSVLKPVVYLLNATANGILRLLRVEPQAEISSAFTREQVEALVGRVARRRPARGERVRAALGSPRVHLAHRGRRAVADGGTSDDRPGHPATEVEAICAETGFSRFPVVAEDGS